MVSNLAAIAAGQGGAFTAGQAQACGYSREERRRLIRSGVLVALRHGIYVTHSTMAAAASDDRVRHRLAVAAALLGQQDGLVACGRSAGILWGLDFLDDPDAGLVTLAGPGDRTSRRYNGVRVRRTVLPAGHVTRHEGIPITTVARTVFDLIRQLPERDGVVLADSALRITGMTKDRLEDVSRDCPGWVGVGRARRVIDLADGRAEAVSESVARMLFLALGFPIPELQALIDDRDGVIGRVDFLFRDHWTIVEVDGRIKYTDPKVLWREKLREDRLRAAGYEVVRLTWDDIVHHPERVKGLILAAFARAAARH